MRGTIILCCCEDGELSILRRKLVDGSFLRNREAFCLDRVYFYHKYRGLVRKVEMRPICMIGVVAKMVNYRF